MNINTLIEIQKSLLDCSDLPTLFKVILKTIPKLGGDFASILLQVKTGQLYFHSTLPSLENLEGQAKQDFAQTLIAQGLEGQVMRANHPEVLEDVLSDSRWYRASTIGESCRVPGRACADAGSAL